MLNIVVLAWKVTCPILFIVSFCLLVTQSLSPAQEARCLSCIRNVTNILGLDTGKRCEGYYCGQYQLSYTYWAEAGKPGNNQGSRDYEKCARDRECSEQAVKAYFKKYKRDCNNDGIVDCLDMAALHKGGPVSCSSDWFYKSRYWTAFNKTTCMLNRELEGNKRIEDDIKDMDPVPQRILKNQTLTQECLDCICDATSGCNVSVNNCGSGTVCGPFAISQAYWKDGRRPGTSWTACTRTKECAGVTVKNYMEKHKKDCNGDGVITCEDYAAIHRRGPNFCSNRDLLKEHYWNKFLSCRVNQKPNKDVNLVKVGDSNDDQNVLASRVEVTSSTIPSTTTTPLHVTEVKSQTDSSLMPTSETSPVTLPKPLRPQKNPTYELASIKFDISESAPSSTRGYSYLAQTTSATRVLEPKPAMSVLDQQVIGSSSTKFGYSHTDRRQESETTPYQSSTTAVREFRDTTMRRDPVDYGQLPVIIVSKPLGPFRNPPNTPTYTTSIMSTLVPTTKHPSTTTSITSSPSVNSRSSPSATFADNRLTTTTTTRLQTLAGDTYNSSPAVSLSSTKPTSLQTDRPMTSPSGGDEPDYLSNEYQYPNPPDRNSNFDKVVIGIVGNPDFTKSYPPIPEIPLSSNNQDTNVTNSIKDQPMEKSQQKVSNTNHLRPAVPLGPSRQSTSHEVQSPRISEKSTVKSYPSDFTAVPFKSPVEPSLQVQHDKNILPDISNNQQVSAVLGLDTLNLTGIPDMKGLNESSRISMECLECICDASSNCDTTVQCISKQREKNRCGMYMISWNQFQESDISLTSLTTIPPGTSEETAEERLYYECSTDKVCAEKLIHLYIEKHQRDCNNDGKIDCFDIAAIHRVGPENCNSSKFLSSQYWKDFKNCHAAESSTTTVQPSI